MFTVHPRRFIVFVSLLVVSAFFILLSWDRKSSAEWAHYLSVDLANADFTMIGEEDADWAGYFASPAGDVNGDGLGDILVGAPMAGDKICPYPLNPDGSCPGLPKGQGVAYLFLGRNNGFPPSPLNLADADASFLGCFAPSMTARQLYTAGDVNGDGYDDFLISGWKCGEEYTGKAYLFLGREDIGSWGRHFPIEMADASFLGENEWDFFSYYLSTAGDVNNDGLDDFLISSTHHEYDEACPPGTPTDCNDCCKYFIDSTERSNLISETWTTSGSLMIARQNHASILLQDGNVLVSGGENISSYLNSVELYDPNSGTWALTGSMIISRTNHAMTLLQDGRVLVSGGNNQDGLINASEIYDPTSGMWTMTGNLNQARVYHTMTTLADGKVLAAGGVNGTGHLTSAEIFDPVSEIWTEITAMNTSRSNHTATLLPVGTRLVLIGGENESGYLNSTEVFDSIAETWSISHTLAISRAHHSTSLLPDNTLMVVGGINQDGFLSSVEFRDLYSDPWQSTEDMNVSRSDHTATVLTDGNLYVIGGRNDSGSLPFFETFDAISQTWTFDITRTLNAPRSNHVANRLFDGEVLVAGGRNCRDFGKVYLLLGRSAADWGTDFDMSQADASFLGELPEDRLGRSATGVGDVNGDNFDDFLIGSKSSDYAGVDSGENYLFLGRAMEDDPGYDPGRPWWGNNLMITAADASFVGEAAGDESGRRVAHAGDVNGDGLDDMLMQAALNDYSGVNAGIAYLVLGRSAADWGMHFSLVNADASFVGEERHDQAGRRISGAGDVNNDGYDDFLVGAPHNNRSTLFPKIPAGAAYLIFGRATIDWGSYFPLQNADITYLGKPEIGVAGYDVAWLNDVNGDDIDDYLIAAYGGRNSDHTPGEVYLLFGNDSPIPVQFLPSSNQVPLEQPVKFTGEFWEPNGMADFQLLELKLNHPTYGFKVRFRDDTNEMALWDIDQQRWIGPCTPGEDVVLQTDLVRLECIDSYITEGINHTLRVTWRIRWKEDIQASSFDVFLRGVDYSSNDSDLVGFGIWPIIYNRFLPLVLR